MCLLVALHRAQPDSPLVVAANRDELLARGATAMTVLEDGPPRVLGGRDHVAGGTWLAVNELSVFGALTNRPAGQRDPARRSRGEWPLFLARFAGAAQAAGAFVEEFSPADFNPGWVLVGDGKALFYVDMTEGEGRAVELEPGIHILENRPLAARSAKVELVRELLRGIESSRGEDLIERLGSILASHEVPDQPAPAAGLGGGPPRPPAANAACVHLGVYGTRSATILQAAPAGPPRVWSSDGPACTAPLLEVTRLWAAPSGAEEARAGG